jgi:hypothetical protein
MDLIEFFRRVPGKLITVVVLYRVFFGKSVFTKIGK